MKDAFDRPENDITPPEVYFKRRAFLKAGMLAASAVAIGMAYRRMNRVATGGTQTAALTGNRLLQGRTVAAAWTYRLATKRVANVHS